MSCFGSLPDVPDGRRNSPLHFASREDNCPIVLALIEGGANVNIRGDIGRTPLHVAVSQAVKTAVCTVENLKGVISQC